MPAGSDAPLRGRVVLVVGASRGLGRAVAQGAARLGAAVGAIARSKPDLDALRRQMEQEVGVSPLVLAADVKDPRTLESAVEETRRAYGRVDAGVYSAGVGYWERVLDMTEERWHDTLDTNLTGAFRFTRAVLPVMLAQGRGQLVYVSSRLVAEPIGPYAAYCASKAGLRALAEAVAKEVAPGGIRVTTILPGLIDTGFSDVPHGRPTHERPPRELMLTAGEVAAEILHVIQTSENTWVRELFVHPARL
ncbi:MAG: SDR family oxidoreductase [Candidatus Rokubacteria bacterium]|nr:SDR family oxidoreductase [Candidatus Rokubacteria bacterium]